MNKKSVALMGAIAAAMLAEPGYHLATPAEAKELIDAGFAEQNPNIADGSKLATRLTEAGSAEHAKTSDTADASAEAPAASSFAIDTDVPLPSARGGKGGSVYPFDDLPVNGSFFVPATEQRPNPAKSLASTVSSATKRYEGAEPARKFTVRSVDETAQGRGKGARVWRTA